MDAIMAKERTARPDLDRGLGAIGEIGFAATASIGLAALFYYLLSRLF